MKRFHLATLKKNYKAKIKAHAVVAHTEVKILNTTPSPHSHDPPPKKKNYVAFEEKKSGHLDGFVPLVGR